MTDEDKQILTNILYNHTDINGMCINEVDFEDVVKDIIQHFSENSNE